MEATPATPAAAGWDRGTDPDYLADLVAYWADEFDWRTHESELLDLPWVSTGTGEARIRAIHATASEPPAPTVVLLHGSPDSFYVLSGGDVGSSVAEQLAAAHPDRVAALHLTDIPYTHLFTVDPQELSPEEQDYLAAGQSWRFAEGAYALQQATKPHTLAAALGDSPAGLAAWIVEKLRSWSDCGGDVESAFPRDQLLVWITLYWVTGTIGTSFAPYIDSPQPLTGKLEIPTVVSIFPHDLVPAPRPFGMRFFDIRAWHQHGDGGHFAAWERPEVYALDLREAVEIATGLSQRP